MVRPTVLCLPYLRPKATLPLSFASYLSLTRLWLHIAFILFVSEISGQAEFVENKGQWPEQVGFRAALPAGALWAEGDGFKYQFYDPQILQFIHPADRSVQASSIHREHVFKVNFVGCNDDVEMNGSKPFSHYYNYYIGDEEANWTHHASVFQIIHYQNIYDEIDLNLYSKSSSIKYDFIVHAGADANDIAMKYDGMSDLKIEDGKLFIKTSVNEIIEQKPFAYQLINGRMKEVECAFVERGNTVRFQLGDYDKNFDVIIDPELVFASYIGSTADNFGFTACNDSQANLISGAAVFASGYPTTIGAFETDFNAGFSNYMDVAITKFAADGSNLLYSTYLGGANQETGHSLICDSDDNIIMFGVTGSADFPTTTGVYMENFVGGPALFMDDFFISSHPEGTDIFISKLQSNGAMDASTFAGGTMNEGLNFADKLFYNYGDAFRGEVNVDEDDNIFVASVSNGNFPMTGDGPQNTYGGGVCDGVVFRMNPALSALEWSSYFGGNGDDACYAVEFSGNGKMIVAGGTRSNNFPHCTLGHDTSHNGDVDGFVVKLNAATFAVEQGSFVGTSEYDQIYFVQLDFDENIYVLGQTDGTMPVTAGIYGQANSGQFIRKYSSDLSSLEWSTTIGTGSGEIDISPTAFLVSDCYQIYFSGWGGETNGYCGSFYTCYASSSTTIGMPVTSDAVQSSTDGSDFYLCVLAQDAASLVYGSFLGGTSSNEHVDGGTSRFDKNGQVYQAVCAGCGGNSDFPTTPGAWSADNLSFNCNIGVFKFDLGSVHADLEINGPPQICFGQAASFINLSTGATDFLWDFGDSSTSTEESPSHIYTGTGTFTITLVATDDTGCLATDTASIIIEILPGIALEIEAVDPVCIGTSVQLNSTGSDNLFWIYDFTLSDTTIPDPIAAPDESQFYCVVDSNFCDMDTTCIWVEVFVPDTSVSPNAELCLGQSVELFALGGEWVEWFPATGLDDPTSPYVIASPTQTTIYTVTIHTQYDCELSEEVTVTVYQNEPGGNVFPDISMCIGNNIQLQATDGSSFYWEPNSTLDDPFSQTPMASPDDTTTYICTIWNPCGEGQDEVTVNVIIPHAEAFGGGSICPGDSLLAYATGGVEYWWSPPSFAFPYNEATTLLSPFEDVTFTVTVIDQYGCGDQAEVYVNVLPQPYVDAGPNQYVDFPESAQLFGTIIGESFYWEPDIYITCTDCTSPWVTPENSMFYYLTAGDNNGCSATDSVWVEIFFPIWVPNTITPNNDGINDVFFAVGENIRGYHLWIVDRWGIEIFETEEIHKVWDGGINGYYVQNDTYVWIIEYETVDRRERIMGHVNVVR